MPTNYHTPHQDGDLLDAATLNRPLGQLDAAIGEAIPKIASPVAGDLVTQAADGTLAKAGKSLADAVPAIVVVAPTADYELPIPSGTYARGQRVQYWITPSGADRQLTLASGIKTPSDSLVTFPKTLTQNKLYIVQLTYSGSDWLLTSLVGGY